MSLISKNVVIPNINRYRENIPDHYWKNRRQHNYFYYKAQPAVKNHSHHYYDDIRIQQVSLQNDYDRDKGVAYGMICSGIPTPKKQATPIITLRKDSNSIRTNKQIHLQLS